MGNLPTAILAQLQMPSLGTNFDNDDDDDDADDDNGDDDEVDWLAWFSAKAVNSPLPNSPLSVPTKMFFYFNINRSKVFC